MTLKIVLECISITVIVGVTIDADDAIIMNGMISKIAMIMISLYG